MIDSKLWYFMAFTVVFKYCTAGNVSDMLAEEAEIESVYAGYIPRGRVINIGNLPVYEAPDNIDKRRMLIAVYDLFGFSNNNMKQIADHMALQAGGFRVALPDFFRGDHWDINVPITPIERAAFVDRVGNWETIIKPDLVNVVRYYQSLGVQEFAIFGMCQGGRTSTSAAIELSEYFKASAIVHPSLVSNDEAPLVRIPMYLMPSSAQPDMLPFYQVLRNRFGDNSGHRRFDDMFHGFASTRGNFSEPLNQMHVNEIIRTLGVFFGRILS